MDNEITDEVKHAACDAAKKLRLKRGKNLLNDKKRKCGREANADFAFNGRHVYCASAKTDKLRTWIGSNNMVDSSERVSSLVFIVEEPKMPGNRILLVQRDTPQVSSKSLQGGEILAKF